MPSMSWLPQAAGGPASFCWPLSTRLFSAHSTSPSSSRGVSGSTCIVTWASAAVLETWAGTFPSEALRSPLLWELVSPHCQVLHPWLLCCELQRKALLKNLYDHHRVFVQEGWFPFPCGSFSQSTDLLGIPACYSSPKKSGMPFLLSCPKQRKGKGDHVTSL